MNKYKQWIIKDPTFAVGIVSHIMGATGVGAIICLIYGVIIPGIILICLVGFWVFVILVIACIAKKNPTTHHDIENPL
jgi:hypothetical protein